jgi:hypothetical protein
MYYVAYHFGGLSTMTCSRYFGDDFEAMVRSARRKALSLRSRTNHRVHVENGTAVIQQMELTRRVDSL